MTRIKKHLRSTFPSLALLLLFVLLTAGFFARHRVNAIVNTVTLPIEVFPPDGKSVHIESVIVHLSDPTGVDSLYLQGHALGYQKSPHADQVGYDKKASFRINGGAWIDLNNANAHVFSPERFYGGIGGTFQTVRLTVGIGGTGRLLPGSNTIEFRFNGTDGIGAGYRIIDFDLFRAGRVSAIDGTSLVLDDPDTWQAPVGSDPGRGKALWETAALLEGPSNAPIRATCSDCHAADGRDLTYFAFSNRTIIARSRFHGLTQQDGEDIAAYIRSIDLGFPAGYDVSNCGGRPWNPPYQPGPGLDDKPVECWAAGAGLEWVLENDRLALPYLFPDPNNPPDRRNPPRLSDPPQPYEITLAAAHPDSTHNAREMPIAIQLPDWNNWLPDIAPQDGYPAGVFEASEIYQQYLGWGVALGTDWRDARRDQVVQATRDNLNDPVTRLGLLPLFGNGWNVNPTSLISGAPLPQYRHTGNSGTSQGYYNFRLALSSWHAVKMWEVHQRYKLEELGDYIYTDSPHQGYQNVGGNHRTWVGVNQALFNLAPHKNGKPGYPAHGAYRDEGQNAYFTSAWYQLQLIVNVGNRMNEGTGPFDWNYHHPHIATNTRHYNRPEPVRWFQGQIVVQQQRANAPYAGVSDMRGWDFHTVNPARILPSGGATYPTVAAIGEPVLTQIAEVLARAWTIKVLRHNPGEWLRDGTTNAVTPASYVPTDDHEQGVYTGGEPADRWFRLTARLSERGVDPTLVDSMARWGESMWPGAGWEAWMMTSPPPPPPPQPPPPGTSISQTISLRSGWNMVSLFVLPPDPSFSEILAGVLPQVELVKDEAGQIYSPELNINEIGSWSQGESYRIYANAPCTLSVQGDAISPESSPVPLGQGWNFVPYLRSDSMQVQGALQSISSNVVMVKDFTGQVYAPQYGIDMIGSLKPGAGYKVYVSEPSTLLYPSNGTAPSSQVAAAAKGSVSASSRQP